MAVTSMPSFKTGLMKTWNDLSSLDSTPQHSPMRRALFAKADFEGKPHETRIFSGSGLPSFSKSGRSKSIICCSQSSRITGASPRVG